MRRLAIVLVGVMLVFMAVPAQAKVNQGIQIRQDLSFGTPGEHFVHVESYHGQQNGGPVLFHSYVNVHVRTSPDSICFDFLVLPESKGITWSAGGGGSIDVESACGPVHISISRDGPWENQLHLQGWSGDVKGSHDVNCGVGGSHAVSSFRTAQGSGFGTVGDAEELDASASMFMFVRHFNEC